MRMMIELNVQHDVADEVVAKWREKKVTSDLLMLIETKLGMQVTESTTFWTPKCTVCQNEASTFACYGHCGHPDTVLLEGRK